MYRSGRPFDKFVTSESGTSRNGTVVRYYKCSTRKKDSTKCHKSPIRKEIPERLIADVDFMKPG